MSSPELLSCHRDTEFPREGPAHSKLSAVSHGLAAALAPPSPPAVVGKSGGNGMMYKGQVHDLDLGPI